MLVGFVVAAALIALSILVAKGLGGSDPDEAFDERDHEL